MRSLVIAITIITLTFGITITNTIWTNNTIEKILEDMDSLTLESDMLPQILDDWKKAKRIFSLTVHRVYLREIDDAFQKAEASIRLEDEYEFASAKKAIMYKMKELCSSQSFDLKTVL